MSTVPRSRFGQMRRRLRLVAGLSREELAGHAGSSVRGINDFKRGLRTAPRPETVRHLTETLAVTAEVAADA